MHTSTYKETQVIIRFEGFARLLTSSDGRQNNLKRAEALTQSQG